MYLTKKALPLLIIGAILWLILSFLICWKCLLKPVAAAPVETAAVASNWLINDGASSVATCPTRFDFNESVLSYISPLSTGFGNCMSKTVDYLNDNPDRSLQITGKYSAAENFTPGVFSNLGLARADNVRNYLIGLGVAGSQLSIASDLIPNTDITNNVLEGGVDFGFTNNTSSTRLDDIKTDLIDNPPAITLRFPSGQQVVNLTSAQQAKFTDIIYYLQSVSTSSLEIGGHTDSDGGATTNQTLSLGRADFVRDYLVQNGISSNKMSTQGYGEGSPLNNNATPQEKALNRRVEVVLKHN